MKTDPSIYTFLATDPEAFRVLTNGLVLPGDYVFRLLTLKGIERRLDGLYEPQGHSGPAYVVEFQAQPADGVWYNLMAKVGLYGERHPTRRVRGLLIFLRESDDPWLDRFDHISPLIRAVYLNRFLPDWLEREPGNPFVAALAPLILTRDEVLRERAPSLWRTIQNAPLAPPVHEALSQVLEYWLFERFRSLTVEEIWKMLNIFTPLEETRAYQSIFAKGRAKGEAEGAAKGRAEGEARGRAEGEAKVLKRQLTRRFGPLPKWAAARIDAAAIDQLDAWLDGIFDAESLEGLIGPPPKRRRAPAE